MPTAPDHPLFTASDLSQLLGETVSADTAVMVEAVVWGWMQPRLGIADRPEELNAQQFSWAIQLGAIAHENPAGLTARQVGEVREQYSSETRDAILDEVEGSASSVLPSAPRGRFPSARAYPDPAERC